jgi:hypothetical protein
MNSREPSDSADELYARALALMRQAKALIVLAREREGELLDPTFLTDTIDFDSLPGQSPERRAEALYGGRRIRNRLFPEGLFGEPAWDILLQLFLADQKGVVVTTAAVQKGANVSPESAARWIALLEEANLVTRSVPTEDDVVTARLTVDGLERMTRFFAITDGQMPVPKGNSRYLRSV